MPSALAAFPIGSLADRVGHRQVVVGGYLLAADTTLGFAVTAPTPGGLLALFVCSGIYIAAEEVAEKAYAARLLPVEHRGVGLGLLAATNGVGDMIASALVGTLWALAASPAWGFGVAALLQLVGATWVATADHGAKGVAARTGTERN